VEGRGEGVEREEEEAACLKRGFKCFIFIADCKNISCLRLAFLVSSDSKCLTLLDWPTQKLLGYKETGICEKLQARRRGETKYAQAIRNGSQRAGISI
jgi:hypothetical protein